MKFSVALLCAVFALFLAGVLCQSGSGRGSPGFHVGRCPDGQPSRPCSTWSPRSCVRDMYCYTSRTGGGGRNRGDRRERGVCCQRVTGIGQCPQMAMGRQQPCGGGPRGGPGGPGGSGGMGRSCRGDWECRGRRERCCWNGCFRTCMRV